MCDSPSGAARHPRFRLLLALSPLLLPACRSEVTEGTAEDESQPAAASSRQAQEPGQPDEAERPERVFDSVLVEGEPMYTVLPQDAIPAVDDPQFVGAEEAEAFMQGDEPVLGVVGTDGTARAYSAWQLEGHEVVNDVVDGDPIAVTW